MHRAHTPFPPSSRRHALRAPFPERALTTLVLYAPDGPCGRKAAAQLLAVLARSKAVLALRPRGACRAFCTPALHTFTHTLTSLREEATRRCERIVVACICGARARAPQGLRIPNRMQYIFLRLAPCWYLCM